MLQGTLSRLDNQKITGGLTQWYSGNYLLSLISIGFFFILNILSIPARIILRDEHGERSLRLTTFLLHLASFLYILVAVFLVHHQFGESILMERWKHSNPIWNSAFAWNEALLNLLLVFISPAFAWVVILIDGFVKHFRRCLNMAKKGIATYSYARGESKFIAKWADRKFFGIKINNVKFQLFVEPYLILKYSFLLMVFGSIGLSFCPLGVYPNIIAMTSETLCIGSIIVSISLFISGIALFLEEAMILKNRRNALLDMVDGEYEMELVLEAKRNSHIEVN
jgi:hypothetical protein